jgi:hypothetical protein
MTGNGEGNRSPQSAVGSAPVKGNNVCGALVGPWLGFVGPCPSQDSKVRKPQVVAGHLSHEVDPGPLFGCLENFRPLLA